MRATRLGGVHDPKVLGAVAAGSREDFVLPASVPWAHIDAPQRIPCGQTTSQPSLVAWMLEALQLSWPKTVLEGGTGLGYEAALLGWLALQVWTVELFPELAAMARSNLARSGTGTGNVTNSPGGPG